MNESLPWTLIVAIFFALSSWGLWFRAVLEEEWLSATTYGMVFSLFVFYVIVTLKGY